MNQPGGHRTEVDLEDTGARLRQAELALQEAFRCLTLIGHVPRQPGRPQSAVRAEAALKVISDALHKAQ